MGTAVSNQCCGGRDDGDVKNKAKEKQDDQSGTDLSRFDEAHEKEDITTMIELLDSKQPFARSEAQIHPWAAPPQTVGALAAFQLASMASKESEAKDQPIKNAIREGGAIPKLVQYLDSAEDDRKHASVVALSFLALDNENNCQAMFDAGALPLLVECLKMPPDGMKGAAADTARNIYVLDLSYRQSFLDHGGVGHLVALLDLPSSDYDPASLFNQSEAIFHIEDFILDKGQELSQFVKAVKDVGCVKKLEALTKVDSDSMKDDAKGLLIRLAD
eukprot:CAMPEP_0113847140 /NCGR_PEP_ID=MMETSP0372-20130328/1703_1 /TAXON_ID=340204 /ORGANISM="Lankesteria abbotti" /LENGTH=273 /DNA_ID=CAMNT_0000816373 /DNA_START=77 /DNA_END=898 /DNA_ORIENTATION=- /assembly_acc=CAM_ASM_000359